MRKVTWYFVLMFLFGAAAKADVSNFRIECDQFGRRMAFEYSSDNFKDTLLVGSASRRSEGLGVYDIIKLGIKEDEDVGEYLEVNYDTKPLNHYGEDVSIMHQLRLYFSDRSFSVNSVTLNKDRTQIVSVTENSTSSIIGRFSNCISIGI